MKAYFGVSLFEIGANRDEIIDILVSYYDESQRSVVEKILNQIDENGSGTVVDCMSRFEADECAQRLIKAGGDAEVYQMSEEEIADAIECGDIIEKEERVEDEDNYVNNEDNPDEIKSPIEQYNEKIALLWQYLLFCIVGWIVATVGFCLSAFDNWFGFILILAGIIIVDIPSFKLLRAGYGLGSLFAASGAVYEITYADGHKETDYTEKNIGFVLAIITYLITLAIGVFVMVFRVFKTFSEAMSIKKEHNIQVGFKDSPFFKPIIAITVFVVGCISIGVCNAIADYQYEHPEDMQKEEITLAINNAMTKMRTSEWSAYSRSYNNETNVYEFYYTIQHANDNSYYVEIGSLGEDIYKIDEGGYLYYNGTWSEVVNLETKETTTTTFGDKLNMFLIESMIDVKDITENIDDVYGRVEEYNNSTTIYYHRKANKGGKMQIRISSDSMITDIYGIGDLDGINIHSGLNFGGQLS